MWLADGRVDEARTAFTQLHTRYAQGAAGADDLALLAATLGEREAALEWLTEACRQRSPFLGYVDVEPAMAALRLDPGAADLPAQAIKYVRRIEELIRCPVALVSTSPQRDDTILVRDPFAS